MKLLSEKDLNFFTVIDSYYKILREFLNINTPNSTNLFINIEDFLANTNRLSHYSHYSFYQKNFNKFALISKKIISLNHLCDLKKKKTST